MVDAVVGPPSLPPESPLGAPKPEFKLVLEYPVPIVGGPPVPTGRPPRPEVLAVNPPLESVLMEPAAPLAPPKYC